MHRAMSRLAAVFLAAAILLPALSGCSPITLEPEALMRPPRPTGEKAGIHKVLEEAAGSGITLKYPASGEYRSAIVMYDVSADDREEAIAFYQKNTDSVGTSIMFINQQDNSWQSIGSFSSPAAQVDKICFGDVNADGREDVIVGWGSAQSGTNVCVYYFDDGKMKEWDLEQSYSQLSVMDFDEDGFAEVFTASVAVGEQPAMARLFRLRGGALEIMGQSPLDAGVTKYVNVISGRVNEQQTGIVLDGVKSAALMSTELLYWDAAEKTLKSPFYDPAKRTTYLERTTTTVSRDINGDTLLEIPVVTPLPGFDQKAALPDVSNVTDWYRYDTTAGALVRVMSMVINSADGYWFLMPDMWQGRVTTLAARAEIGGSTARTVTFSEWLAPKNPGEAGTLGEPLLVLQAFSQKDWAAQKGAQGFTKLLDSGGVVYAAKVPNPQNAISIDIGNVKAGFKLLSAN